MSKPRIAIIHDLVAGISGTERVLKALSDIYPEAPIFCIGADNNFTDNFLPGREIRPMLNIEKGFLGKIKSRLCLIFSAAIIEFMDLRDFDLIISSGAVFSKGVITRNTSKHINYCHSPTRQIWDWHLEYQEERGIMPSPIKKIFQHLLRVWDSEASLRPDLMIANSIHSQKRITKYYKRDSTVIYPPVKICDIDPLPLNQRKNYYVIVSRLYKHKNVDLAIRVFNKMGWNLVIIGEGPLRAELLEMANSNIKIVGNLTDKQISKALAEAKGFILPQEEDFGIAGIEALAHGTPILALAKGGALEFIKEGFNGTFFKEPTEEIMAWSLKNFKEAIEANIFDPTKIRQDALRFSEERFKEEIVSFVNKI